MECSIIEDFYRESGTDAVVIPERLQRHISDCSKCRSYRRFVSALATLKNSLDRAPAELLPGIVEEIIKLTGSKER